MATVSMNGRDLALLVLGGLGVVLVGTNGFMLYKLDQRLRSIETEAKLTSDFSRKTAAAAGSTAARSEELVQLLTPPTVKTGIGAFTYQCATGAVQAECTLTNTGKTSATACWRGIVHRKGSSATAESVIVCTGEVKALESKTIAASYSVGAVRSLCPGSYGGVSWDDCNFDVDDVTAKVGGAKNANEKL